MEIKDLELSFGTQVIFKDVNLHIPENEKVGVVGLNGAGKTTFFKLILGREFPDAGKIIIKNNARVGWLPQVFEDDLEDTTIRVYDYLKKGRPVEELEKKLQGLYDSLANPNVDMDEVFRKINNVSNQLTYWDANSCESMLSKIIDGIGITNDMLYKHVNELSGGQKSKISFARLLYSKPEILLLDEPTNHMDAESKEFITNFLKKYNGTVLVISHDVEFLDNVTTKTLFLDKRVKQNKLYDGNYTRFTKLQTEYEEAINREAEKQQREEEKLKAIINKYANASGKKKKMAQDREKKLDKLLSNKIETFAQTQKVNLKMNIDQELNNIPVAVENLCFKYDLDGPNIIDNLSFSIYKGEKFLVVGRNGVGKSTLLKLINNILIPQYGDVKLGSKVIIGYYAQEFENIDSDVSIIENFGNTMSQNKIRSVLAKFLFTGDDIYKKVSILSPGERARVALAKLSISGANLLLLDEPTNHLDPETQNIIGEVFNTFDGSMIVVSHNTEFVKKIGIERVLILPDGKIQYYDDKIVDYYHELNQRVKKH